MFPPKRQNLRKILADLSGLMLLVECTIGSRTGNDILVINPRGTGNHSKSKDEGSAPKDPEDDQIANLRKYALSRSIRREKTIVPDNVPEPKGIPEMSEMSIPKRVLFSDSSHERNLTFKLHRPDEFDLGPFHTDYFVHPIVPAYRAEIMHLCDNCNGERSVRNKCVKCATAGTVLKSTFWMFRDLSTENWVIRDENTTLCYENDSFNPDVPTTGWTVPDGTSTDTIRAMILSGDREERPELFAQPETVDITAYSDISISVGSSYEPEPKCDYMYGRRDGDDVTVFKDSSPDSIFLIESADNYGDSNCYMYRNLDSKTWLIVLKQEDQESGKTKSSPQVIFRNDSRSFYPPTTGWECEQFESFISGELSVNFDVRFFEQYRVPKSTEESQNTQPGTCSDDDSEDSDTSHDSDEACRRFRKCATDSDSYSDREAAPAAEPSKSKPRRVQTSELPSIMLPLG